VIQFVVIYALGLLLVQGRRPTADRERATADRERVEAALADIRGALSVGSNYTQLQEKVQALAAAIENLRAKGGAASDLARFERSEKLYKDSLDLLSEELSYPGLYERFPHGRYVPPRLESIAKEQGFDLSEPPASYKIFADVLLQQLWTKADQAGRGVSTQKELAPAPTEPKR